MSNQSNQSTHSNLSSKYTQRDLKLHKRKHAMRVTGRSVKTQLQFLNRSKKIKRGK